jgi:hypothetical protein
MKKEQENLGESRGNIIISNSIQLIRSNRDDESATCEINCDEFGYSGCSGDCGCDGDNGDPNPGCPND